MKKRTNQTSYFIQTDGDTVTHNHITGWGKLAFCHRLNSADLQTNFGLVNFNRCCTSVLRPVLRSRIGVSEVKTGLTQGFQDYEAGSLFYRINHLGKLCWTANLLQTRLTFKYPITTCQHPDLWPIRSLVIIIQTWKNVRSDRWKRVGLHIVIRQ